MQYSKFCWEGRWYAYAVMACIGIVVYTVGIPGTLYYVLRKNNMDSPYGLSALAIRGTMYLGTLGITPPSVSPLSRALCWPLGRCACGFPAPLVFPGSVSALCAGLWPRRAFARSALFRRAVFSSALIRPSPTDERILRMGEEWESV